MLNNKEVIFIVLCIVFAYIGLLIHFSGELERLGSILFSFGFYYIGYKSKKYATMEKRINKQNVFLFIISLVFSLIGTFLLTVLSGNGRQTIDIHHNVYPDVLLTYAISISGIMIVLLLSSIIERVKGINVIISNIGKESLIIYPIITFLPIRIEHIILSGDSYIWKIGSKVISILICILIIWIKNLIIKRKSKMQKE